MYDDSFSLAMDKSRMSARVLSDLCRLCNIISNNSQLVMPNTAQCLPSLSRLPGNTTATTTATTTTTTTTTTI